MFVRSAGRIETDQNHVICVQVANDLRQIGVTRIAQSELRDKYDFTVLAEDDGGEDEIRHASIGEKCEAVCAELAATHGLPNVRFKAVGNRVRFER